MSNGSNNFGLPAGAFGDEPGANYGQQEFAPPPPQQFLAPPVSRQLQQHQPQQQMMQAPPSAMGGLPFGNGPMTGFGGADPSLGIPNGMVVRRPRAMGSTDGSGSSNMLGMSTLVVGIAALVGARFGGVYGGLAGSLFGGAGLNAYRAAAQGMQGTPASDREALISGTYAIVAAGVAGYVLYRSTSTVTSFNRNGRDDDDDEPCSRNSSRRCGIRPID